MMQLAVNSGELDKDLCSSATMCRFENMVSEEDLLAIQEMFVTMFVLSYNGKTPKKIILDCDDTNVDTYGVQELTLFNSYYDSYCYMPLLVFEGFSGKMILPLLKPGAATRRPTSVTRSNGSLPACVSPDSRRRLSSAATATSARMSLWTG